jgi:hypothetical protein
VNGEAALATALNASLAGAQTVRDMPGGRNQTKH